jgi:predicted 2-oxoglutarate/Fe(II)-dependent dioxygenase YbiX/peroxiredoxin
MLVYSELSAGDPSPWFWQRTRRNTRFPFHLAAGRHVVLCFYGSAQDPQGSAAIEAVLARPELFNGERASFFGVSISAEDEASGRFDDVEHFWDFDGSACRMYGALPRDGDVSMTSFRRMWFVLDPMLRIVSVVPFSDDGSDVAAVMEEVQARTAAESSLSFANAPVLTLPHVFEPAFCDDLVDLFRRHGGRETGVMREIDGRTVVVQDITHKRREDYLIEDTNVIKQLHLRFSRRILPMMTRAFQINMTRMERYIVSRYSAEQGGHFGPHRDNLTKGTAHRKFAASVNLNEDFSGGEVMFPEFGSRLYKPPKGGVVIFSCSLLHCVSKVSRGERFAFLPFLYDEQGAQIRKENLQYLQSSA